MLSLKSKNNSEKSKVQPMVTKQNKTKTMASTEAFSSSTNKKNFIAYDIILML